MKTIITFIAIFLFIPSVNGCVSKEQRELTLKIAAMPSDFIGESVRVCGYVRNRHEDHGIFLTRKAYKNADLPILGLDTTTASHDTKQCLSGTIIRTGCGEELICLDYPVAYSLKTDIDK